MSELTTAALLVTGPDAFTFLQNQLTNDLRQLATGSEILAAWCNPKGRVIWFGPVCAVEGGYALTVPVDMADEIVRRLTVYRFRARVDLTLGAKGSVDAARLIRQGRPFIAREQAEKYTPHMLNLDLLDAVSFDKGCFPGQEIVARTRYRGATKRRCFRFASDTPVSPGARVSGGTRDVGDVVNAEGTDLLAVVPVHADHAAFTVSGTRLTPADLPYVIS